MRQSKASMVVPCYNKEAYIGDMLKSVYAQKWDNIELILVNDGSTDGTRAVISEWEPRLRERGYEVVIIDQENAGCCAAVYNGMLRMTGDYFCLVDCDDEIDPEYVSKMAGWLDEHGDYEWAACSYRRVVSDGNTRVIEPPVSPAVPQDTERMLENWILWRITAMSWIYMIRASYMKRCGMLEAFCTERRATYEPCVAIPPASGGGRLKFFDEPLYIYNKHASELSGFLNFEKVLDYYSDYLYLTEWVINRLNIPEPEKAGYISLARLTNRFRYTAYVNVANSESYRLPLARDIAEMLEELIVPAPHMNADEILETGLKPLFEAVRSVILELDRGPREALIKARRVIGYGALGKRGQKDLPLLKTANLFPNALWDNSAGEGSSVCGVPVVKPDFGLLTPEDTVIVFPTNKEVLGELNPVLRDSGVEAILYRKDIAPLLYREMFPKLLNCRYRT